MQRVWNALKGIRSSGQITDVLCHDFWWKPGALIWRKMTHFMHYAAFCESESEVAQSRPTLCDPVDCSPPGSSIHGIIQARVLEWAVIAFSIY